jgi:hypothetical protein
MSHVDPKVKSIRSTEGPEFWYDYIRGSWTLSTVTIDGGRCLWIPVDPKVHVALRVRDSGMFILGVRGRCRR